MPSAFLKKLKIGIDFSESFAIIITLSLQGSKQLYQQRSTGTAMEKSPSWSRAHDWKSCRPLKGLEGSNPSFSAIQTPVIAMVTGGLLYPLVGSFPLVFPLQLQNVLDEALHALCAGPFHLVRNMAVHIQCKGRSSVSQVALHRLDVVPRSD